MLFTVHSTFLNEYELDIIFHMFIIGNQEAGMKSDRETLLLLRET